MTEPEERFTLFGEYGWGSVLVETQLVWYWLAFDFEPVGNLFKDEAARRRLAEKNPLAQIPTLVTPDGTILTESAAITLWLSEHAGRDDLVPAPGRAERARFLRWLIFLTSNVYPTYTYADDPARFVSDETAAKAFKRTVTDYSKRLYRLLDGEATGPWFLGTRFSAVDIFVCTMTHWRPGEAWFRQETPTLAGIADATQSLDRLNAVWERNFPPGHDNP